jgi:hypothetical protein
MSREHRGELSDLDPTAQELDRLLLHEEESAAQVESNI